MNNIVILGASRAGKTTLARKLCEKYPRYHLINGDAIRNAFQEALPENKINKYNGEGMKENFAKFSASLLKYQIKQNKNNFYYIFDTCDISVENAKKYFNYEDIIIIFLGYADLTEEQALFNYRKYESENDWTTKMTDLELLEHAKNWINNSKKFKSDCERLGIRYVDTSTNREEIIENLLIEITK